MLVTEERAVSDTRGLQFSGLAIYEIACADQCTVPNTGPTVP